MRYRYFILGFNKILLFLLPHDDEQLFAIGPERSYIKANLKPIEDFNDWGGL